MAEYIAREVLLAQLRAMESYNVSPMYRRGYDDCVATVLNAPAADVVPTQRWIPLTEQLPPMGVDVLLCHEYGCVIGFRDGYKWGIKGMTLPESIYAWMPIPEVPREMFI